MKFNLGDVVTIRADLKEKSYGMDVATEQMVELAGQKAIIFDKAEYTKVYKIMQDGLVNQWNWTEEMFEERTKKAPAKPVAKVKIPKTSGTGKLTVKESVIQAIQSIQEGEYGGTYLKLELEGHLNRGYDWGEGDCYEYIRSAVSQACKDATVFAEFCNDGSVDSEFMFTVPLSLEGVNYAIEYIQAFKALAKEAGHLDVSEAGMHITILRSEDGDYPYGNGRLEAREFRNFKRAMNKLMPALYLLASEDWKSRGLYYRIPQVGDGDHHSAVDIANHGDSGCLEWRVFETCYDRPEMLYDFICVIAKGLAYYSKTEKPVLLGRIGKLAYYDNHLEYGVHKYFQTEKHLEALDKGLKYLLPDHRTIGEVKQLRNFKLTKSSLEAKQRKIAEKIEDDFDSYRVERRKEEAYYLQSHLRSHQDNRRYNDRPPMTREEQEALIRELRKEFRKQKPATRATYLRRKLEIALTGSSEPVIEITI